MRYEELEYISRAEAAVELDSGDRERVCPTLVRLALFDRDRVWLEAILERFLKDQDPWIRGVAATCVGHVARIHRAMDLTRLLPLVRELLDDPATAGKAQDALDDVGVYLLRGSENS
jgi:hypothetical protein